MPLLDLPQLNEMLNRPAIGCLVCGAATTWNYCRECDEFFTIGHRDCSEASHLGHRMYPAFPVVPFETRPGLWVPYVSHLWQTHVWLEHAAIAHMMRANNRPLASDDPQENCRKLLYQAHALALGERVLEWTGVNMPTEGQSFRAEFGVLNVDLRVAVHAGQVMLYTPKLERGRLL